MPPKGVKKTKQTEQKKIVTSTLLAISSKFDNHLNAKEIISLQRAKDYIREISKLKIKSNDARSRQVSEKLTFTLKGLINEYTNKVTGSENTNTLSLNNNFEKKINENFESKSNQGLNIITESCEAFVVATNADYSQNKLIEPVNIEDRTDINNKISIPIDNMSKIFQKEENFNTNGLLCIMGKENIDKSNLKDTNDEPSAKNKTACTNDTEMIVDTECINNRIIPKDNVNEPSGSKKRNSKNKRKNNLTWIENIKFIREIDAEEHLVSNLEESFWSDLTKPANCSLDFETD